MSNFEVGVRLTADGKDLIGASRQAQAALGGLKDAARGSNQESASFTSQVKRQNDEVRKATSETKAHALSINNLKTGLVAAAGAYVSFNAAIAGGRAVVQAALAQERLNNSLRVGLGSQQAATREIKFLREESDRLGLQFTSTAAQYAKLAAASKGTRLEGQATRDIFLSIAKASTVLGLSADQTGGALTAIEQIISKGTVSAEELRGQLGERLPGAFQVAARSINVTTKELGEMLQRGELTAEQLLPALARELEKTYGAESQAAAQGLNAQINRLDNSFNDLKLAVADAGIINMFSDSVVAATEFIGITARIIEQIRKIGEEVSRIPLLGAAASNITPSNILKTITGNNILGNVASSGIFEQLLGKDARAEVVATTQELQKAEEVINRIIRPGAKPQAPAEFVASVKREAEERKKLADQVIRDAQRAAKAREDEEKRAVDGAKRIIDALKRETEEVGKNAVQKRLMAAAAEAAKAPTQELAQEIMASAQAWAQATQAQEESIANQREMEEAAQARARAEVDAARQVEQQWRQMWSTVENTARTSFIQFAALGTDAMKSIGRAIQNSIIDLLYQLTIRPFIINVGANLTGQIAGNAAGAGINTLSAANLGATGLNILKTGFGLTPVVGKTISGIGNFIGSSSLTAFGGGLAGDAVGGLAAGGFTSGAASAASLGASVAAVAGPAIALLAVDQIGKFLANGRKTGTFVDKIPVIGGIAGALFGRKAFKEDRQDLVGTISASGFEGVFNDSFKAKGSLFRGSRRDNIIVDTDTGQLLNQFGRLSESGISGKLSQFIDPAIERARQIGKVLDDSVTATAQSLRSVADTLDISAASLDNFSLSVDLTTEKGEQLADSQIAQVIADAAEQMATGLLPQVSGLSKSGESALQTLVRLSGEFSALESTVRLLGQTSTEAQALLKSFSLEQRSAAVEMAGGIEALNNKTQFFFNNVLTDTQKFDIVSADLRKSLEKYGVNTIPTVKQLNNAVTSGKLSWEQFTAALDLAPMILQANQYRDAINAATGSISSVADSVSSLSGGKSDRLGGRKASNLDALESAFAVLQRSITAERDRITKDYNESLASVDAEIKSITDSVSKLKTLSAAINQTVVALRPISRDVAKQQIQDAINVARSTGRLPDSADIREALTTLARRDTKGFSSRFEFEREQRKTAALIDNLGELTDSQLSSAEDRLDVLKDQRRLMESNFSSQIGRLDSMLAQGKERVDLLKGIRVDIKSLAEALSGFNSAASNAGLGDIGSGVLNKKIGRGDGGSAVTALPGGRGRGSGRSGNDSAQIIRDFVNTPGRTGIEVYTAARANNVTSKQISDATGIPLADINAWVDAQGLPRFAGGGLHSGGLRIVGERGPELEATGPARIASNNDLQKMLSNDDVVAALRLLITEIKTNNDYNRRVANKLDGLTINTNGKPALRTGT